jgi:uncharacterized protein YjbJ (UPF0337 family)
MNYLSIFGKLTIYIRRSLVLLGCMGFLLMINPQGKASAAPVPQLAASGFLNQVTGKAEKDAGTVERNLGKATGQAKGVAKQVSGRAKQDIGRTQSAAADAAGDAKKQVNRAVNKAESAKLQAKGKAEQDVGKTQDFLGKVGDKIEDTASSAVDSVKGLLQ